MHYHCSKLYTVYKREIIQVVVWSRVSCTTNVQNNYTLSTSATVYKRLFGAVLVALPSFKNIHCLQARHILQLVVWGDASCTTTFSKRYTVYKLNIIQVVVWSRVSCTTTVQNYTLSTGATLYRRLFGAVLVALPLFKTIHCLQARHYSGGCLERCYLHYHVQNYTLSTCVTLYS